MAILLFNKLNGFVEHMAEEVHDLDSDTLILALSNTAPGSESTNPDGDTADCILANVTQISYANCSSRTLTGVTGSQSGGTYTLDAADITLTASGGSVGPFRYIYIYNDSTTSPVDALIGYFDYGSSLTLADGESIALVWNASGIPTVA